MGFIWTKIKDLNIIKISFYPKKLLDRFNIELDSNYPVKNLLTINIWLE